FSDHPGTGGSDALVIAVAGPGDSSQPGGDRRGSATTDERIADDILWKAEHGDAPLRQFFRKRSWRVWVSDAGEAPQPAWPTYVKPGLVGHRPRAAALPGAAVEDQHRLDRCGHVGSGGGVDAATVCASAGLELVPQQPGAEVP